MLAGDPAMPAEVEKEVALPAIRYAGIPEENRSGYIDKKPILWRHCYSLRLYYTLLVIDRIHGRFDIWTSFGFAPAVTGTKRESESSGFTASLLRWGIAAFKGSSTLTSPRRW